MLSIDKEQIAFKSKIECHKPPRLEMLSTDELCDYFVNTWELYELLFSSISYTSTYYLSPDPLRNPLIFYYGHTAAFYVNKLIAAGVIDQGINAYYETIFARGVDPELPQDLNAMDVWPTVNEVIEYRETVFDLVMQKIKTIHIPEKIESTDAIWALLMSFEHDRIHFETSSVLIRQLNDELLARPNSWHYAPTFGSTETNEWIAVTKGGIQIGNEEPCELYGWDNEFGSLNADVKPFYATKNLITNGEFLEFVHSGAYNKSKYWTEEGLEWKKRTNTSLPKFWTLVDGKFRYRAMFDFIDMPLDWPIEVNKFEALAFLNFMEKGHRLLTEVEFKLIAQREHGTLDPALSEGFNLNMAFGSPTPVGYLADNNDNSFNDLYGNVWDWLDDAFYPLPGFTKHPWYKDFSEPFFDNQHSMLLGGCWATSGTGASKFYRLWFRDYFYQHAGFRMAKDAV